MTLLHGDCLEMMKTLPAESVDCIVTDPPYGIDYQSARRTDKTKWKPKIANDSKPFIWFLHDAFRLVRGGGAILCFSRWDCGDIFKQAIEVAGFVVKSQVIWDREIHGMGDLKRSFAPQHDIIWFGVKGDYSFPGNRPKSIIRSKRIQGDALIHPNEKPVDLLEQLINAVTHASATILDPFMGSGSTGVACQNTGRNFIGIELDQGYFEIAKQRLAHAQSA